MNTTTITSTSSPTANTTISEILAIADEAIEAIGDQHMVGQPWCVDVLLDLLVVTQEAVTRSTIVERLRDIRFLSMVAADDLRADLAAIVAISTLDVDNDLSWARQAFDCSCERCVTAIAEASRSGVDRLDTPTQPTPAGATTIAATTSSARS